MASSSKSTDTKSLPLHRKKIKVRKLTNDTSSNSSSISLESQEGFDEYIPLAARDSKWVGLNMCNSDLLLYSDYKANEEEVVIMEVNEEEELPIYSLFPSLRDTPPEKRQLVTSNESTADITKLLVGQKPDFTHMKKSKRFSPAKLSLPKLEELPNEEKVSESKLSKLSSRAFGINRGSESSNSSKETHYDDDGELEYKKIKKIKRYKKRPIPLEVDTESSYSGIAQVEKSSINKAQKKSNGNSYHGAVVVKKRTPSDDAKIPIKIKKHSSNGSLADEES